MGEHVVPGMGEHVVPGMGEHGVPGWVSTEYLDGLARSTWQASRESTEYLDG
jgi:hypothetical protein